MTLADAHAEDGLRILAIVGSPLPRRTLTRRRSPKCRWPGSTIPGGHPASRLLALLQCTEERNPQR